jgi:uroporphyrinogen decarboxylase
MTLAEREQAIARFSQRLDAAMKARAPTKAWVRKALRRQGGDRCPVRLRRLSLDVILRHGDALADLFCRYPDDVVATQAYEMFAGWQPDATPRKIVPVQVLTEEAQWTDEWGTEWHHAAGGVGATPASNPLTDWSQLDDYLSKRMPDPRAPGRLDGALPSLRMHGESKYVVGMTHLALFERFHCLRGMENTFADFYESPAEADRLIGALTDYLIELARRWGQLGKVDAWFITDDWGTQAAMMISPELWRKFFAARYRRICEEAHRWDMDVIFHSCGNVTEIVGDLIDVGVDVVDPLQPEAMDLKRIAREFGGKVAFSGGISDQELVAFTPAQVRDHVRRTIETIGKASKNAYIVAPSNVLPPEIPLANLEALFEACHSQ